MSSLALGLPTICPIRVRHKNLKIVARAKRKAKRARESLERLLVKHQRKLHRNPQLREVSTVFWVVGQGADIFFLVEATPRAASVEAVEELPDVTPENVESFSEEV